MRKTQFKGVFILLLTAFIWGSAFVAQSVGLDSVDGFTFNGIRTLMGAAALLPVIIVREIKNGKDGLKKTFSFSPENITLLKRGSLLGVALCAAGNVQQFAFYDTQPGKVAFITAFYMFFVPVFELLFFRKKVSAITWICVAAGVTGLYFLCVGPQGFSGIVRGDILALICSVLFAVHIILIDRFSPGTDGIKLSFIQFTVAGLLTCVLMFIFEKPSIESINATLPSLLYSGVLSCGLAYTLQIIGQKYTEPSLASLLMCMESVFGVLSSAVLLHQQLLPREYAGCAIMFAAIIISQLSHNKQKC